MLGKAAQAARLFEFLVTCQGVGRVPREAKVAADSFEHGANVGLAQDATDRVAARMLRWQLEEFVGASDAPRLILPRGECRLVQAALATIAGTWLRLLLPCAGRKRIGAAVIGVLLAVVMLATSLAFRRERDEHDSNPRLIGKFAINSRRDLEQDFLAAIALQQRYAGLKLGYLPASSVHALREVRASGKPLKYALASELDPATENHALFPSGPPVYSWHAGGSDDGDISVLLWRFI